MRSLCHGFLRQFLTTPNVTQISKRFMPEPVKRFYKNVTVAGTGDTYEVNLDHRKMKTPSGKIMQVPNHAMALAIANEWALVKEKIVPSWMHLTGLTYTVIDNPNRDTKFDIVSKALDYMDTDTLLYRDDSTEEFIRIQQKNWDPVLEWFNERFDIELKSVVGICGVEIPVEAREAVRRYMLSHNIWTCQGFLFAVEALKSIILTIAAAERKITIQTAVNLSYLETDYQRGNWGNVEWAHDLEKMDHQTRFAAAMLFVQLNSSQTIIKHKLSS